MIEFTLLLIILFVAIWQACLIYAQACGAPSVFANKKIISATIQMAEPKKNQLLVDLGCGDARSLILGVSEFDLDGIGVERSPYCWVKANLMVLLSGKRNRIKILFGDFDKAQKHLSQADIVYLYLSNMLMEKNEKWLFQNLKRGAKIVSLSFQFKHHKPVEIKILKSNNISQHIYLYENNSERTMTKSTY